MQEITQDTLKRIFDYNPDTGEFIRRITTSSRAKAGDVAGVNPTHKQGYTQINIGHQPYLGHRLAWLYMTGALPDEQIDHINGVRHDNRFCNLRLSTNAQNGQNRRGAQKNSKSGILGVHYVPKRNKWTSQIKSGAKRKTLGYFDSASEARAAYIKEKRRVHEFCTL